MARRDLLRPHHASLNTACAPGSHQRSAGLPRIAGTAPGVSRWRRSLVLALAGLAVGLAGPVAHAQKTSPNQPLAIDGLPPGACPLLVPGSDPALQPLRIQPSQVARKNAIGCLSPADAAVYGPDGCPLKLCRAPQGTMPLPKF